MNEDPVTASAHCSLRAYCQRSSGTKRLSVPSCRRGAGESRFTSAMTE
ncbi:hypothetical protein [Mycobacterium simiae]